MLPSKRSRVASCGIMRRTPRFHEPCSRNALLAAADCSRKTQDVVVHTAWFPPECSVNGDAQREALSGKPCGASAAAHVAMQDPSGSDLLRAKVPVTRDPWDSLGLPPATSVSWWCPGLALPLHRPAAGRRHRPAKQPQPLVRPAVDRWLSEDPIGFRGGDENLYRYGGNNSLMRMDPQGTNWLTDVWDWLKEWFDTSKTSICPSAEPSGALKCAPGMAHAMILGTLRNKALTVEVTYGPNSPQANAA